MRLPSRSFFALLALALAPVVHAQNTGFAVEDISISFEPTPVYNLTIGPQRKANSQDWMMIEAKFGYEPRDRTADPFLDELTLNYYVLLGNKSRANPTGTLLVGTVTHVAIAPGKDLHSVAFVSPRTIQRFFEGKFPGKAQATQAVGVTISQKGQVVAELSSGLGKGKPQWWNQFTQTQDYVLSKDQTPFAPLFWDYYEALKAPSAR